MVMRFLGSWFRESLLRKRFGLLRLICRLLCIISGDNVFFGLLLVYCNV